MQFISTRNNKKKVGFSQAITNCLPSDGGMYVPAVEEDLRPWILYMNETTSFTSIAGSLTSALLRDEFSPIISEGIATRAFPFSPYLKQLDDKLFALELFHGPTGSHKDFGISYLTSCLEHFLLMEEKDAIVIAVTNGETGVCLAKALKKKQRIKAVLLYSKGSMRGLVDEDFVWNGGNIYPVEVQGSLEDCYNLAREIYSDRTLVERYGLTLANTVNIGRLLPNAFLFTYAFTRLKKKVVGDIFFSLNSGNYGSLVAGLYSWKFSLPVSGFITECTDSIVLDVYNKCKILDSMIPLEKRSVADIAQPSNLERLEEIFSANPAVLKGLVYPSLVTTLQRDEGVKELFKSYGYFADLETATAHIAAKNRQDMINEDDGAVVLLAKNHPALSSDKIKTLCGETPEMPDYIRQNFEPVPHFKIIDCERTAVVNILHEIK